MTDVEDGIVKGGDWVRREANSFVDGAEDFWDLAKDLLKVMPTLIILGVGLKVFDEVLKLA